MLWLETVQPRLLLRSFGLWFGLSRQDEEELRVPTMDHVGLPTLLQLFVRVLPDELEHPVTDPTLCGRLCHHQRLVHETGHEVQEFAFFYNAALTHCFGSF